VRVAHQRRKGNWNPLEFVRGPVGFAVGDSPLECNGGVCIVAVVQKVIGRPLHHTLRGRPLLPPCSRSEVKTFP
jgi:hypothetical protein